MVTSHAFCLILTEDSYILEDDCDIRKDKGPWLNGLSVCLQTKGLPVQFPVRTYAWVTGQVPSWGHVRGSYTSMFLSLPFSLPSPLFEKNNKRNIF